MTIPTAPPLNGEITLFEGQTYTLTAPDNTVTFVSSNENVLTVTRVGNTFNWTIAAGPIVPNTNNTANISAIAGGNPVVIANASSLGQINFRVEKFSANSRGTIRLGDNALSDLLGVSNGAVSSLTFRSDSSGIFSINGGTIRGNRLGTSPLTVLVGNLLRNIDVTVGPRTGRIDLSAPANPRRQVTVGQSIVLEARLFDSQGATVIDEINNIQWDVPDQEQKDKVLITPRAGSPNVLDVDVLESDDKPVRISAQVGGLVQSIPIFIKGEDNIVGFDNIELRMDSMDDTTVKDLFGSTAAHDYFVAKLRIFNKVPADKNGGPSSSILFFSESLEVHVSLQKRPRKRGGEWTPLNLRDIMYINDWDKKPNDDILTSYFIEEQGICDDQIRRITKSQKCEISREEFDRLQYFYRYGKICGNNLQSEECKDFSLEQWVPFRPYAFLIITSTHDRRSDRSPRAKFIFGVKAVISMASFVNALTKSADTADFTFGLDKFNNLLVPAYEKLFPSRREVQRKNIVDMALLPFEEIPFGKETAKVVFIPKDAIQGVLPDQDVRIAAFSVYKITAEASIVNKEKIENRR